MPCHNHQPKHTGTDDKDIQNWIYMYITLTDLKERQSKGYMTPFGLNRDAITL